jgi:hypothetical protein
MKKTLTIVALAALMLTSGMEAVHAQSTRGRGTYGPQQAGWNCPWMGQSNWSGQRGGWYCGYGGGWNGNGSHGYRGNGRGNGGGQYRAGQRAR